MKKAKGDLVADTINGMAKKLHRLKDSSAVTSENMLSMIHAGKL